MKHDKKKQWLSIILLTLGAAALAVFAAATLDAGDVRASLAALLPGWTAAIVGCMLLYYLCDALKYQLITRAFGCAQPLGDSIDTSMIGFFYSAVTPAAAGGQPFQVLHMHHRGIPTGTATSVICTTYCLWNVALVTLGIVGMCLCGGKLAAQSAAWIPVLALGLLVHAGLLTLVLLSAIFPKPMSAFGTACIRWMYRQMEYGSEQYPGFFTHHALGFVRQDTADGKQQMRQTWQHILDALTMVLTRDKKIRPDAFTEEFSRQKFAGILFSLMLSAVVQQDFDPTAVLEIIRRTIYEV